MIFEHQKIIDLCTKNNRDAQSQLYDLYSDDFYKFLYFLSGNKETAEDILQNLFLNIFKNIKKLKKAEKFKEWSIVIAKNLYFDYIKQAYNQKRDQSILDFDTICAKDDQSQSVIDLKAIISKLSIQDRELFVLIEICGYTVVEAAKITSISVAAAKSRLLRLKKSLSEKIK